MKKKNDNRWFPIMIAAICIVAFCFFLYFGVNWFNEPYLYQYPSVYIIIPLAIFAVSYLFLLINSMRRRARIRKTKETYELITNGLKDGTVSTENDIRRIYEVYGMADYYYTFASFLDKYLVFLLREKDEKIQYSKDDKLEGKISYQDINTLLSGIIKRERTEKPYEGVNEYERKLLQDIETAADNNRPTEVKSGLSYLANALMESQKTNSKENRRNRLLTIIGVIVTVLSLIAAIIIFFIQNNRSLTSKDVKQDMKEVIDSCAVIDTNGVIDYRLQVNN